MALPAIEDSFPGQCEPDARPTLVPSRPEFSVEGYREGTRTCLFLQGAFDPAMAHDLRLFLADLVTGSHELMVDLEGFRFSGTLGPSGLELTHRPQEPGRTELVPSDQTDALRLLLDSLCTAQALEEGPRDAPADLAGGRLVDVNAADGPADHEALHL